MQHELTEVTLDGLDEDLLPGATSLEDLKSDLAQAEAEIAREYRIRGRRSILSSVASGELPEGDLVARWVELYSAFKQWCKHDPPKIEDIRRHAEGRDERPFCFSGYVRSFLSIVRRW